MASNEEVNANRAESESSDSSRLSTEIPIPYNRPVTQDDFAVVEIPTWERVYGLWNKTNVGKFRCCFTANDILANDEYNIRYRITECVAFGGKGAKMYSPRVAMFWARNLLIRLWCMKGDTSAKMTMTHKEIYKSNIGRTLNAFRKRVKIEMERMKERIKQVEERQNIIGGYEKTLEDINSISKLLVEFANENNGWNIEDLGLLEYEQNDENGDNEDEGNEGEDGDSGDNMES